MMSQNTQPVAPPEAISRSAVTFEGTPAANLAATSGYGQLHLPEGKVVHLVPSHPNTATMGIMLPSGYLFASAIGAMLQSRYSPQESIENHVVETTGFSPTKVSQVEWSLHKGASQQFPEQEPKKKSKRKKKSTAREELFDGCYFFHTVVVQPVSEFDLSTKECERIADQSGIHLKMKDPLRKIASTSSM